MAYQISNPIGTGTPQEELEFARAARVRILAHGQRRMSARDRELWEAELKQVNDTIAILQAEVAASSSPAQRTNYATRGRAV